MAYSEHVKYSSSCFNSPSFSRSARCNIIIAVSSSFLEKDNIRSSRSSERFLRSCSLCRSRFSRRSNSVVVIRCDRRVSEPDAVARFEVNGGSVSHPWSSFKIGAFLFLVRGAEGDSGWDVTKSLLAATLRKERMSS